MNPSTLKRIFLAALLMAAMGGMAQSRPKVFGRTVMQAPDPATGLVRCASTEYEQYLLEKYPERDRARFEAWIAGKMRVRRTARANMEKAGNGIITIPVVVHVIHDGEAVGSNENIADGQIESQIAVLNQDYRRMAGTRGFNDNPVGADTEIEFCLAKTGPNGQPTNGIDRINLGDTSWTEWEIENNMKPVTIWDPDKYLNIWVCNFGGDLADKLGYAQFPSGSGLPGFEDDEGQANTDGVVIHYAYFGSDEIYPQGSYLAPYNKGRTTTHEVGHALGLIHTWGDQSNCTADDFCEDTPIAFTSNTNCPPGGIDSCPSKPGKDMVENYMDYTNDVCMNVFTRDQKERMLAVLENSPRRKTLATSGVCQTGSADAGFSMLNSLALYPNPAKDKLYIVTQNGELPDSYTIYNSLGQMILSKQVTDADALTVSLAAYSKGIYFIRIQKGSQSRAIKFIKE